MTQTTSKETGLPLLKGEVIAAGLYPVEVEVRKWEARKWWQHMKGGWIDLKWETRHPVTFEVTSTVRRIATSAARVDQEIARLLDLQTLDHLF